MKAWLLLALAACQRSDPAPPAVASGSASPPATTIVGCAPAAERPRVRLRKPGETEAPAAPSQGWFPYATAGETPDEQAAPLAAEANALLAKSISDLDLCLTDKVGSVSLMLDVAPDGSIKARAGGIGHRPTELCIERLIKTKLSPSAHGAELECGLSIGAAGPLRVTVEAGYRVVEVKSDAVIAEGKPQDLGKPADKLDTTQLVVVDPDADTTALAAVLDWLSAAPAVLVAVKADGGPPVFLAMGPDRRGMEPDRSRLALRIVDQQLATCTDGKAHASASLLEPKRVDAMLADHFATCGARCSEVVEVAVAGSNTAKQLVGATSAVRRSGHDPVLALSTRCEHD